MIKKMDKTIVLASGNEGKAREFRAVLEPLGVNIVLQKDFGIESPAETGSSFLENAMQKARYAAEKTQHWALADDSGLCVRALNGAPGIYSARYSGGFSQDNNEKLLRELKDVPAEKRDAFFYCALCLVRHKDDPTPLVVTASWEGSIAFKEKGSEGFGYDPLFLVKGRDCTAAQLPPQVKNLISHRGRALCALTYHLEHDFYE